MSDNNTWVVRKGAGTFTLNHRKNKKVRSWHPSLKLTANAPENRVFSQKGTIVFQPLIFRGELLVFRGVCIFEFSTKHQPVD